MHLPLQDKTLACKAVQISKYFYDFVIQCTILYLTVIHYMSCSQRYEIFSALSQQALSVVLRSS